MNEKIGNIGQRIKNLREQKGFSQTKLSKLTGIRQSYLSEIELGKRNIRIDTADKIYLALGISLEEQREPLPHDIREVPIVGIVSAGEGIYAEKNVEETVKTDNPNIDFYVKVKGDSLIEDCIYSGDILGVSEKIEVKNGDLAIVAVGPDRCKYVKRVYIRAKDIVLQSRNPNFVDMIYHKKDIIYLKKVIDMHRNKI